MLQFRNPFIFLLCLTCIASCGSDDDSLSVAEVSAVEALYAPVDGRLFELANPGTAVFEWQSSRSGDNGVVLYEVAFDRMNGDFSAPVFVMPADGRGFRNELTLSFTQLNQIAELAGIERMTRGGLQWTVLASKGLEVTTSTAIGNFEVRRAGGFDTPGQLSIIGGASEGGDDPDTARSFKKTGPTTFEIYTRIGDGAISLVGSQGGQTINYSIDGQSLGGGGGETMIEGGDEVYRIRIDFSDGSVSRAVVNRVELWFPPRDEFAFEFAYEGDGVWAQRGADFEFKQEDWGRDERYKFKFSLTDSDGNAFEEWFGSVNNDNQRPDGEADVPSFYHMLPVSDDFWANSFKFRSEVDMASIDVEIIFNTTVEAYTHRVIVQ